MGNVGKYYHVKNIMIIKPKKQENFETNINYKKYLKFITSSFITFKVNKNNFLKHNIILLTI